MQVVDIWQKEDYFLIKPQKFKQIRILIQLIFYNSRLLAPKTLI